MAAVLAAVQWSGNRNNFTCEVDACWNRREYLNQRFRLHYGDCAIHIVELDAKNFEQLADFADGFVPDPKSSVAIVAVDGHRIVGRVFLMQPVHLEGPFVLPEYRGTTVAKSIVDAAEMRAKKSGIKTIYAYGADETLCGYLERIGYKESKLKVFTKDL